METMYCCERSAFVCKEPKRVRKFESRQLLSISAIATVSKTLIARQMVEIDILLSNAHGLMEISPREPAEHPFNREHVLEEMYTAALLFDKNSVPTDDSTDCLLPARRLRIVYFVYLLAYTMHLEDERLAFFAELSERGGFLSFFGLLAIVEQAKRKSRDLELPTEWLAKLVRRFLAAIDMARWLCVDENGHNPLVVYVMEAVDVTWADMASANGFEQFLLSTNVVTNSTLGAHFLARNAERVVLYFFDNYRQELPPHAGQNFAFYLQIYLRHTTAGRMTTLGARFWCNLLPTYAGFTNMQHICNMMQEHHWAAVQRIHKCTLLLPVEQMVTDMEVFASFRLLFESVPVQMIFESDVSIAFYNLYSVRESRGYGVQKCIETLFAERSRRLLGTVPEEVNRSVQEERKRRAAARPR